MKRPQIVFTKPSSGADCEKRNRRPESQVDSSAFPERFTQSAQVAGKGKVRMNKVDDRDRLPMTQEEANEIERFVNGKVKFFCRRPKCPYPLSETNREIAKTHLLHVGIKALERWDETKHGRKLKYVCGMIKLSSRQIAARVYWAQCKRGESRDGDLSLDAKMSERTDSETSFIDLLMEDAEAAYRRQRGVDPRATTQQNIDTANAQLRSAQAQLASAKAQAEVAEQVQLQIRQQETNVEARQRQVDQARAQLENAELNLSWTEVRAPFDGYVTKRNVQTGTLVQAGSALFSLVSPDIWVVANFKESQLERMRPGNKVTISIDAWPDMELEGHIDSIQQGSGSRFSAFPAENATGNFVKIVQRVPVKIVIDKGLDTNKPLPLGLSVEPKVTLE